MSLCLSFLICNPSTSSPHFQQESEIMEEKHSGHGKFLNFPFPFEELSSWSYTEGVRGAQEVVLLESAGERGPGPGSTVCALLSGPSAVSESRIS